MSLTSAGISHTSLLQSIASARRRLTELSRIGLHGRGFRTYLSIRLYKALVRPISEYLLFFNELTPAVVQAYRQLEGGLFSGLFGSWALKMTEIFRDICRLESLQLRHAHLAASFIASLKKHKCYVRALPHSTTSKHLLTTACANLRRARKCPTLSYFAINVPAEADTKINTLYWARSE